MTKNKVEKDTEVLLAELESEEKIIVQGARVHNLRNIDVEIPRNKLTVITGLSGSGKSSLAFDTIYAEGQRRYIETFSAYARSFLGNMERPDVDKITGLSPVISIEQKVTTRNPRSTVGTVTEIYDFLRLLYARVGEAFSYNTGEKMVKYTEEKIINLIKSDFAGKRINILAPVVKGRKGHYRELFEQIRRKGFLTARIDGELTELMHNHKVDRYKNHFIEIVIDKLVVDEASTKRLKDSVQIAMKHGHGVLMILDHDTNEAKYYSRLLMCPTTGISYNEPAPYNFSFNSPQGACPKCNGLGRVTEIDLDKIMPEKDKSINKGGIAPLGPYKNTLIFWQIEALGEKHGFTLKTPVKDIPQDGLNEVLFGTNDRIQLKNTPLGNSMNYMMSYDGVIKYIDNQREETTSKTAQKWANQFVKTIECPECKGMRLKNESLHFKIDGKNISELARLDLDELGEWLNGLENRISERQLKIGAEVIKEIRDRLGFMLGVGLNYLALDRSAQSLSGGESQRIRLATQIGSQLVNVLYILDEPSIGLHHRDNLKLIQALEQLRDSGNSVVVVEHDRDTMLHADHLIDMGPHAGRHGGEVVAAGTPQEVLKSKSLTADYLNERKKIEVPAVRRNGKSDILKITGCTGNNLNNVTLEIPLGKFICVTGVSGSGKSTLINETLQPILSQHFYKSLKDPLPYKTVEGLELIDKVIRVDQSPIGRTPRSNPVTYTNVFGDIRSLFAQLPEAKIRGYKPGRFSFNVKGGRCEECQGGGLKLIEMNFLPDVYVHCDKCNGKRYNRETLEVRYKGKSISDVLDMTINQGVEFFDHIPSIANKLSTLQDVGLGYITLGQSSTTLSGGESQRVKLASELAKRDTGKTIYILDEPTTGLHFEDVRVLLEVLNKLVEKGNTVIVIEHNMDVIKVADHIIDVGPEGGKHGGKILCTGTPEEICTNKKSHTAKYLKQELGL
ncbi:Excinuclease ABC subunit A [Draconibacterium orientale]|uniref:UvrABC system protein A n=1 Tax=Draconibacterium orientale TaxID=1168034 RepID=X5DXJ9_9BACT|nr:excinuclease ABC subunit UvrA [Draconibacterium orientale]AHW59006.1 excinuclease ABC subunit A [Draconibacterium orientale]SET91773.1 Excinuclease ABC subunit A [Draconibacterium orientale]